MKRLYSLLASALLAGTGVISASQEIDSLSYAVGHQYTLATMAGENDLMRTTEDFREYIRGIEDNYRNPAEMRDSSYMMSYYVGVMEAATLLRSRMDKEAVPPFRCIIAGLRKVAGGEIALPADTVAAIDYLDRHGTEGIRASDLDEDTRCRFFEAYGIMKAYQPGLQSYIDEIKPASGRVEDRAAFATGMADALEVYTGTQESAYNIGKLIAFSLSPGAIADSETSPDFASVVAGAKAALGLGAQLIPRAEVERIVDIEYGRQSASAGDTEQEIRFEKPREDIDRLEIDLDTAYSVKWQVTACTVADETAGALHAFRDIISRLNIPDTWTSGILMVVASDGDGSIYDAAASAIRDSPLPEGYKWFCGNTDGTRTTIGIMETSPAFSAVVRQAAADIDTAAGLGVSWRYDAADAPRWAEFTEANIGRHVAVEIDGRFMCAPRVNSRITGGSCSITGLTPEDINLLFRDSRKKDGREPAGEE